MKLKESLVELRLVGLRKGVLALAVLALSSQVILIGEPRPTPLNLFNSIVMTESNVLSAPNPTKLVTYSSKGNLNRDILDSDRDTVAILSRGEVPPNEIERQFPIIGLVRSPSRTVVGKSEHKIMPRTVQTRFPSELARGELDPYFAGATNASEDLIIGFDQSNSQLAVLRNFDTTALGSTSNPNPDLAISKFIRFNCRSNPPVLNQDDSVQYQPCNNDPAYPDLSSSVRSISTANINCDSKLDIMVVADSTLDINDPNDRELGQRIFGCINYTVPGSSNLDFRCRDQGFRSVSAASAALRAEGDPSNCNGSDDCGGGGGGGVELPLLPQGARFATNLGNSCNGEYRGIGASEYSVVEFLGNFNHPTPAIAAVQRSYDGPVAEADLAFINNDSLPDAVVLIQPEPTWLEGPSADMNSAARVEVCFRDLDGDGLECTLETQPRMVARGVYLDGAARYEYRDAKIAGITEFDNTCDSSPEILVASTGAGLGAQDTQAGYEFSKDVSMMALSRVRADSYNLPLSSLCIWPGNPQWKNQSVCSATPTGAAPTLLYAGLGNFTSRVGRNPALTYPVDSVILLQKEGINAAGEYQSTYDVKFVSSTNTGGLQRPTGRRDCIGTASN